MRTFRPILVVLLICFSPFKQALAENFEFCVGNTQELLDAINDWQYGWEGDSHRVKLQQGTYNVGTQLGAALDLVPWGNGKLYLLGGYTAGCVSRSLDARNTTIDGEDQIDSGFAISGLDDLLVEGISFVRFRSNVTRSPGAIGFYPRSAATFTVQNSRFVGNSGHYAIDLGNARFVNNLVANNTLSGQSFSAAVFAASSNPIAITNNTITNNTGGKGLYTTILGGAPLLLSEIANNIVWGNTGTDLSLVEWTTLAPTVVSHNIYGTVSTVAPLASDNQSVNPQFINAPLQDYRLSTLSPAINNGAAFQYSGMPGRDLFGGPRVVGSRIDRGAIESTQNDLTSYTVTTTSDNGSNVAPLAGSLRAAIKAANAATVPFEVRFQISGACPRILNVVGNMLDITGDVTINGTTQAGWIENVQYTRFDGTLCLLLNGSDGASSTPWAFHVPSSASNARLAVRGVMFAGFSDAAIKLEGGDNHLISGNQFGGIGFTVPNNNAVRVTGNAGNTMIGGFDWAGAINLIAGSDGPGVVLDNAAGGSVLGNNLIGFQTDGVTAAPNQNGVYVFNSPSNSIMYNSIGNSDSAGILISGSGATGNVVQNNVIGMSLESGYPSAVNHGAGVLMMFGARNTTVGASLNGSGGDNLITLNGGPGVWVSTSGGTGNRILGNTSYANQGLAIDLGVAGGTENQANPGVGPNALQNYPLAMSAISVPAGLSLTGVLNSTPNTLFRIDAYRSNGCGPDARAESNAVLGHFQVTTNAQGLAEFNDTLPLSGALSGQFMGLTATDSAGNTSEIGNCELIRSSTPVFKSGFEACENGDPDPGCAP